MGELYHLPDPFHIVAHTLKVWALFWTEYHSLSDSMEGRGNSSASGVDDATPASKRRCQTTGKFRTSWKLPVGIGESSKDSQYAHCSLCKKDFSVAHGDSYQ